MNKEKDEIKSDKKVNEMMNFFDTMRKKTAVLKQSIIF